MTQAAAREWPKEEGSTQRLETLQDVDDALAGLAELDRQIMELDIQANERIDEIKAQLEENCEPIQDAKKRLEKEIEDWLRRNRKEFTTARSRQLRFGEVGFRLVTSISYASKVKEPDVLAALHAEGLEQCITVRESLNKHAAAKLTDETLAKLGLRRKVSDKAWFAVKQEVTSG